MLKVNEFIANNAETIKYIVYALYLPIFLYISSAVIQKIYERDYTYRHIKDITRKLKFTDMLELGEKKRKKKFFIEINFIRREEEKARAKFLLLDEERNSIIYLYLFMRYGLTSLVFFSGLAQGGEYFIKAVSIIPIVILLPEFYVKSKITEHEKAFENYSYKIFKFINNQRTAGVPTQKLISKLHLSVTDQKLKRRLISFAAEYIANNDFDVAFNTHIMKYYSTGDARILDSALRQGLNIGDIYTFTDNEEELMFEKYMSYVDHETEKKKIQTVIVAALYSITLIGIVAYPIILDVLESFSVIFSSN